MKELIPMDEYGIFADDTHTARANSMMVAQYFSKRHADVLRDINRMDCSFKFSQRNFAFTDYTDQQGKMRPCVAMTRDGFIFLVMGYRGKRAAEIKEAYITQFNLIEKSLAEWNITRQLMKPTRRTMTDAIRDHTPPELMTRFIYANYTNMAYKAALGLSVKQLRQARGIPKGGTVANYMNAEEIDAVKRTEALIVALLDTGAGYQRIKETLYQSGTGAGRGQKQVVSVKAFAST